MDVNFLYNFVLGYIAILQPFILLSPLLAICVNQNFESIDYLMIILVSQQFQEFNKHDKEPAKYIKQWRGIKPKTGAPYSCDIGYERFLGPEV